MSFKLNAIFRNFQNPTGCLGKLILWGMNTGHSPLSRWEMSHLQWKPNWHVLDIGCGGGANLAQILQQCRQGKAYGIDLSAESVAFARKKNKKHLSTRCFVTQGTADNLPYADHTFDAVTAFETVYFWNDLPRAFAQVARVLKKEGLFLICCELHHPSDKKWTNRIEGMAIRSGEELRAILSESGFSTSNLFRQKKGAICIVAKK